MSKKQQEAPKPADRSGVPIVGIGASAGGLEAVSALLRALPADTGLAFVVILHLDPTHPSQLAEILMRATAMRVRTIESDMPVEPDVVYVIPPGKDLSLEDGRLQLAPRPETRGQHHPIDHFLCSLGEDRGHQSIGVILSGAANDGTLGLEQIAAAGGLTFAQDGSAEQGSMPSSAIAAGCVDFVLSPAEIAQELARISRHPFVEPPAQSDPEDKARATALERVLDVVRGATGVDFTQYKHSTLHRRIARRMVLHRIETLDEYVRFLETEASEPAALQEDILISVTGFFRNPEAFEALKSKVFPKLTQSRSRLEPVRAWVLGCSTGEEAYSLAMAFLEFTEAAGLRVSIQIFATDLNAAAIERARTGFYTDHRLREVSPERLRRFFVEVEGGHRISNEVRDLCVFASQNVLSDPPFSRLDLITCRNLLIYLEPALQQRLLPILHFALNPAGFLWLGSSETIGSHRELFEVVDAKLRIYSKHGGASRQPPRMSFAFRQTELARGRLQHAAGSGAAFLEPQAEADRLLLARYAPPAVLVSAALEVLQFRGDTGPFLAPSPGRPSLNLLKLLRAGLLVGVRGALSRAKREGLAVREDGLCVQTDGGQRDVNVEVVPVQLAGSAETCYLVLFEEPARSLETRARLAHAARELRQSEQGEVAPGVPEAVRLKQELESTREYLQSVIEQEEATNAELQAANEEIQSSNEELQSINEELETSKEEIQSSNEELATVNDELHLRNQELVESNNDMANLLSSVQLAIVMLGEDLRIRRFTPAAAKLLNLIPADLGRPLGDIKLNFEMADLESRLRGVIDTDQAHEQELLDRHGRAYLLRLRPYETSEKGVEGALLVLVDIDQYKRGQETIRRQAELLELTQEPIFIWRLEGEITYWNRGAVEIYGYSKEEALGRQPQELLQTSMRPMDLKQVLLEQGEWAGELTQRARDGQVLVVDCRMTLVTRADGERVVLEATHPITERKRHEEALRKRAEELAQADQSKNEFLALLAHELRNPLASLRNATQLVLTPQVDAELLARAQATLERQTANMVRMVDDLLDVSRITRGEVRLRREPVELSALLKATLETVQARYAALEREVALDLPDEPIWIEGDPLRLEQVFGNLLSNAWKFTGVRGHIGVSLRRAPQPGAQNGKSRTGAQAQAPAESAIVRVRDDGLGIEEGALRRVFDMFVQLDRSPGRTCEGLGIGLTLARTLARMHGGDIEAASDGLAQGSEFSVRLPALPRSFRPPAPAPAKRARPQAHKRIVVVDDNADAAAMIGALLRISGHEVDIAHDGPSALEKVERFHPDVVLLDIGLPGMDGYEIARRLRARRGQQPRLIALSGYGQEQHVAAARAAGFDHHLTKPVDIEVLQGLLAQPRA